MIALTTQRCANHPHREAAARCPECGRFFCRECVVEHESRVLCASCLAAVLQPPRKGGLRVLGFLGRAARVVAGFLVLWFFFYYLGRILLAIPTSFHEGTVWTGF